MDETLHLKFRQHDQLRQELLATGDAQIIDGDPVDAPKHLRIDHDASRPDVTERDALDRHRCLGEAITEARSRLDGLADEIHWRTFQPCRA